MKKIIVRHAIPLIGPYCQSIKELKKEFGEDYIDDEKEMWSFSQFQYNESVGLKNNSNYWIRYFDIEFPWVMEDFNFGPSMEKIKKLVEDQKILPTNLMVAVPPCAGLSTMGWGNQNLNQFLLFVVKFYLATDTDVLCFENAPGLSTEAGTVVINQIKTILRENGYDRRILLTQVSTLYHGLPQNRKRTFAYLYKGPAIKLQDIRRKTPTITDFIQSRIHLENDPMSVIVDNDSATEKFVQKVEQVVGGFHFLKNETIFQLLCQNNITPETIISWNLDCLSSKYYCKHIYKKFLQGKNFWDNSPLIVKDYLGAITSKNCYKYYLPQLHRLLTLREIIDLMGYPVDFQLDSIEKDINVICQNIPITTATDSIKWGIQILSGKLQEKPELNKLTLIQSQHDDFNKIKIFEKSIGPLTSFSNRKLI